MTILPRLMQRLSNFLARPSDAERRAAEDAVKRRINDDADLHFRLCSRLVGQANRPSLNEQLEQHSRRDDLRIESLIAHIIALQAENARLQKALARMGRE